MRKLDLRNVEAIEPGEREKLPEGGYIVRIEDYEDNEEKEYVRFVFDVNEGPRAGFYSDEYYAKKPWMHSLMFSYKEKALPMTKGRLEKLSECNPGFDAVAAFEGAHPEMFVGRKIGLVVGVEQRVFKSDDGWVMVEDLDWMRARIVMPDKVRSGDYEVPKMRELSAQDRAKLEGQYGGGTSTSSDPYGDIPL